MINKWLVTLPGTNAVIATGILLAISTATRYQLSGVHFEIMGRGIGFAVWTPSDAWLLFVTGAMTVGGSMLGVKRATFKGVPPAPDVEDVAAASATNEKPADDGAVG